MAKIAWLEQCDLDAIECHLNDRDIGDNTNVCGWLDSADARWVLDSASYPCGYFLVGLWRHFFSG